MTGLGEPEPAAWALGLLWPLPVSSGADRIRCWGLRGAQISIDNIEGRRGGERRGGDEAKDLNNNDYGILWVLVVCPEGCQPYRVRAHTGDLFFTSVVLNFPNDPLPSDPFI